MNPIEVLAALLLTVGSVLVVRALMIADRPGEPEAVLDVTPERKAA